MFYAVRVKSLIRQADEVVEWHVHEVRNQEAHRGRMERRFDSIEESIKLISDKLDDISATVRR